MLMNTDLKEKSNKICNHIEKSLGSSKFRVSALGLEKLFSLTTVNMLMKNVL